VGTLAGLSSAQWGGGWLNRQKDPFIHERWVNPSGPILRTPEKESATYCEQVAIMYNPHVGGNTTD